MDAHRAAPTIRGMGVLPHVKELNDALGCFLVQITCKCGARRIAEPEALAYLCGSSATLEAVGKRMRCSMHSVTHQRARCRWLRARAKLSQESTDPHRFDYDGDTEEPVVQSCGRRVEPWPVTKVDVCAGRLGSALPQRPLTPVTATAACASATPGRRSSRGRHFLLRVFPGRQAHPPHTCPPPRYSGSSA